VREVRSGSRYVVEVKNRTIVVPEHALEPAAATRHREGVAGESPTAATPATVAAISSTTPSLDLHGKTVAEALHIVEAFINDALLSGATQARVVHGRSGGRIRAAVHRYLQQLHTVAAFRLDPQNAGVTLIVFR
jgi:DNA mismatch repair protein MutS2